MPRTLLLSFALLLYSLGFPIGATEEYSIAGRYEIIIPPQPTSTPDKVEIVEVFWYGCPHCYSFLSVLDDYIREAPEYVEFRRMPAIFRMAWSMHARAFYIASALGIVEQTHRAFFEELHENNRMMVTEAELREFFGRFGISEGKFNSLFRSFAVQSNLRKSEIMQVRYGISGTPTLVVNGKYRVTARLAGSVNDMILTASALAAGEHQGN